MSTDHQNPFVAAIARESNRAKRMELLLIALREFKNQRMYDPEMAHSLADDALLAALGSQDVSDAFNAIHRWYA